MITNTLDDFILSKDKTYWKALLNDGTTVYQDDDRPGFPDSSWLRLKEYCTLYNLYPTDMWVIFRSHTEYCGHSDIGFFFSLGLLASPGIPNEHRYVCGPVIGDNIHTVTWRVPELINVESDVRPLANHLEKTIICSNL